MAERRRIDVDKVGATASAICAVHCLLTGLAFGLLSVSGLAFLDNEAFDTTFILIAACLGAFAVISGRKKHHSNLPGVVFAFGMTSVIVGNFFLKHVPLSAQGSVWGHYGHTICMVTGGLSLVTFHAINVWLQHHAAEGCESCAREVGEEESMRPAESLARIS